MFSSDSYGEDNQKTQSYHRRAAFFYDVIKSSQARVLKTTVDFPASVVNDVRLNNAFSMYQL